MSERPVDPHEVREMARRFERMAMVLRQGTEPVRAYDYIEGAAMAYESASLALMHLAAVGIAEAVVVPIPKAEEGTEDPIEQARRQV